MTHLHVNNYEVQLLLKELNEKVDQLHSAVAHTDELRDECVQLKQQLVSKDDVIHHLEAAVSEERDKVAVSTQYTSCIPVL